MITKLKWAFCIFLILSGLNTHAQNLPSFKTVGGFGFPELFHAGVRAQISQKNQIGLYYGTDLHNSSEYGYNSISIDHLLSFAAITDSNKKGTWYFRQGLSYGIDNSKTLKTEYVFINLCMGREFKLTSKISLNGELGLFRSLVEIDTLKDPDNKPWFDLDIANIIVLPAARIQLAYQL